MSALTVTLGADISALKRAMAGATELVGASARRMGRLSGAGLAGIGKGGAAALSKGFSVAGTALKMGIGAALAGGTAAAGIGIKAVTSAADFEQTKVAFTTLIGDAGKAEQTHRRTRQAIWRLGLRGQKARRVGQSGVSQHREGIRRNDLEGREIFRHDGRPKQNDQRPLFHPQRHVQ